MQGFQWKNYFPMICNLWFKGLILGVLLIGYLSMSQKVDQIQNRQFFWNLCQSTPSWSRLTIQNNFGLWWPVWLWQQPQFLRPLLCHDRSQKLFLRGENLCKIKFFHQVTDWDHTKWPIGNPAKWLWKQVILKFYFTNRQKFWG